MNVLHYTTYSKGGAGLAALRINSALALVNVKSDLEVLYKDETTESETAHDFRSSLGFFENIKLKIRNKNLVGRQQKTIKRLGKQPEMFSFLQSVWDVTRAKSYDSADIIHFHWVSGFLNYSEFFEKNKKPVLFTLHDHFPFSGGFHYSYGVEEKAYSEIIVIQQQQWKKIIENKNVHFATPSHDLRKYIENFGVPASRVRVIRNPVNSLIFTETHPEKSKEMIGLSNDYKYLLFVSDHIDYKRKGFDQIVALEPYLPDNVRLLVAGGNPGKFVSFLNRPNVIWLGQIDFETQMARLYNSSSLLINPSMDDIYSNTILEASSCGIPSLCHAHGGIQEVISPGVNGFYFSSTNPQEMANDIVRALNTTWNRDAMSKHVRTGHCLEAVAGQYENYYRHILQTA
ncbi:MAG: glycosyltransferase [Flavobacteriales bacterium]